jgi:GH24 family phage-related lysozyme (muramidase)
MTDSRLQADVRLAEGCRLVAYRDTNGVWTIGYGHALEDGKDHSGLIWTQDMADTILDSDLANAQAQACRLPEWSSLDTACRQNAVIELVFNMGLATWETFTGTRAAIRAKQWASVYAHLLNSEWAQQVGPTRAHRIANYLLSGAYPNAIQQG